MGACTTRLAESAGVTGLLDEGTSCSGRACAGSEACCTQSCSVGCTVLRVHLQRKRDPFLCGPMCAGRKLDDPICVTVTPLSALAKSKTTTAGIPVTAGYKGMGGETADTWVWGALPGAAAREELLFNGMGKAEEFSLKVHRGAKPQSPSGKEPEGHDEDLDSDYLASTEFRVAEAHLGEEVEYPLRNNDRIVGDISIRLMAEYERNQPCQLQGDPLDGGNADDEVVFDPPRDLKDAQRVLEPLAVRVSKRAKGRVPKTSWSCTLLPSQIGNASKGKLVESEVFRLPPFNGDFRLRFYPRGRDSARDGYCSLYLWSEEPVIAQVKLYVNDISEVLKMDGPAEWRANGEQGFNDFAKVQKGSVFLRVEVLQAVSPTFDDGETVFFAFAPRL